MCLCAWVMSIVQLKDEELVRDLEYGGQQLLLTVDSDLAQAITMMVQTDFNLPTNAIRD